MVVHVRIKSASASRQIRGLHWSSRHELGRIGQVGISEVRIGQVGISARCALARLASPQ